VFRQIPRCEDAPRMRSISTAVLTGSPGFGPAGGRSRGNPLIA
jgi:hypothetical protein